MDIGVVGCAGRMGRMVAASVLAEAGCRLAGGTEQPGSEHIGADLAGLAGAPPSGALVGADADTLFGAVDAVIDFTTPAATAAHAGLAAAHGTILVAGTTGLDAAQLRAVEAAGAKAVVVHAANMSVGVNLVLGLTAQVAGLLGPDYDIEIVEMHHRHKVDAPSGTALAMGRAAAAGRGVDLEEVSQRVRDGHTGARRAGDIGFATLRGGDVVGEHTVVFAAAGERVEITHKASSRAVFASGAVRAALWARDQAPGLYTMRDVLGFD
jgi:4-hydroxy-tetrahydrodipicolinate reductase